jgi:hypothetical protein
LRAPEGTCSHSWIFSYDCGCQLRRHAIFITTDTQNLILQDLPWRQRQAALATAFPQKDISVVVTATTPENAEQATDTLQRDLSKHSSLLRAFVQPDSGDFFRRNGLLFEPLLPSGNRSTDCRRLNRSLAHSRPIQACVG